MLLLFHFILLLYIPSFEILADIFTNLESKASQIQEDEGKYQPVFQMMALNNILIIKS